jgi:phosphoribosyl 1,2-cyclic phosphodiesterase
VPENLSGILITHEHSDHIQGLTALAEKLRIPVYCNRPTQEAIQDSLDITLDCRLFSTGASFEIGDVLVETFAIPHDAQDPVGYLLRASGTNIGFLTDLGHATKLVLERVRPANVLVLESNHDVKLLQDCPRRPWSLKQRILGRHGHLSPELAQRVMHERLQKLGASHVSLALAAQHVPCPTLTI